MQRQYEVGQSSNKRPARSAKASEYIFRGIGRQYVRLETLPFPCKSTCGHCGALKLGYEPPTLCCYNGEVMLAPIFNSDALLRLHTHQDQYGSHFRQYARLYNNFFAFNSLGGNLQATTESGIHTLQLQGQIYH